MYARFSIPIEKFLCQLSKNAARGFRRQKSFPGVCPCPGLLPSLHLPAPAASTSNTDARVCNNSTERDTTRRLSLRQRLTRARMTCPLFDTRRWVRDAEDLLRWAWERHEAGLPPAHCNGRLGDAGQEAEGGGGRGEGQGGCVV